MPGFKDLQGQPKSPEDWHRVWSKMDLDNSGEITFNEFLPLTLCMTALAKKESVAELFKLNVQDGSD